MTLLIDLFLLRDRPFRHACEEPAAAFIAPAFIALVGFVYGAFVAFFHRSFELPIQGIPAEEIPNWVLYGGNIISGVLIAVVVHAGLTLIVWLMARAVGGPGILALIYRVVAYVVPLGLPAIPRIAFAATLPEGTAGAAPLALDLLAIVGAALFLAGLYRAIRISQGTTPFRSGLAAFLAALFSLSILAIA